MPVVPGTQSDAVEPQVPVAPPVPVESAPVAPETPMQKNFPRSALDQESPIPKIALSGQEKSSPDEAARILKLEMKTGVPSDFIKQDVDGFEKQTNDANFSPEQFVKSNPALAQWASENSQHLPLIKDDMENVTDTTGQVKEYGLLKSAYDALGSGLNKIGSGVSKLPALSYEAMAAVPNAKAAIMGIKPEDMIFGHAPKSLWNNSATEIFDKYDKVFSDRNSDLHTQIWPEIQKGNYAKAGRSAFASTVQMAPGLAVMMAGGIYGLMEESVRAAAEAASRPENQAANPTASLADAVVHGGAMAASGQIAIFGPLKKWGDFLSKDIGQQAAKNVISSFAHALGYAVATDATTNVAMTVADDIGDYATGINPHALDDKQKYIEAGLQGAAMGTMLSFPGAAHGIIKARRDSQLQKDFYTSMGKSAEASKVKERMPEKYQEMVNVITKDGPVENVYVDPKAIKTLFQGKGDEGPKFLNDLNIEQKFDEAEKTEGFVEVPLSKWVEKVAGTDYYEALADDVKFDPEKMTTNESKRAVEVQNEFHKTVTDSGDIPGEGEKSVIKQVEDKLVRSGMGQEAARKSATLYNFFNVLGKSEGLSAEEIFKQFPLKITREPTARLKVKSNDEFDVFLNKIRNGKIPDGKKVFGPTLSEFIKNRGGITNSEYLIREVRDMGIKRLITKNGMQLDRAAEAAHESGYMTDRSINELLDRLSEENLGSPSYSPELGNSNLIDEHTMLNDIKSRVEKLGYDFKKHDNETIKKALEDNLKNPNKSASDHEWIMDFLSQKNEGMAKGSFSVFPNGESEIKILQGADLSTFFHESAHYFMHVMGEVVEMNGGKKTEAAPPKEGMTRLYHGSAVHGRYDGKAWFSSDKTYAENYRGESSELQYIDVPTKWADEKVDPDGYGQNIKWGSTLNIELDSSEFGKRRSFYSESNGASNRTKEIYKAILEYAGVNDRAQLEESHQEKIAEGFEKYLMTGKAPSHLLREAFAAFKAYLIHVYQSLKTLYPKVKLNAEVTNAFDRMLATDEEIQQAKNESALRPMFKDYKAMMKPDDADKYSKVMASAENASEDHFTAVMMKQVEKERQKLWKDERADVEARVTKEVNERPEYQVIRVIREGVLPNGETVPGGKDALKLNRTAVLKDFGKEIVDQMPRGIFKKDGISYHTLSDLLDIRSDEMVMMLANAADRKELIKDQTDQEMRDRHAGDDPAFNGTTQEEAMKAVHNAPQSERMAFELKWIVDNHGSTFKGLMKSVAKRVITAKAFHDQAQGMINEASVRDVKPNVYLRSEVKAANEAMAAALKGDWESAFKSKYTELLNHELYRAAQEAKEVISDAIDDFKKITAPDSKIQKSRDLGYVNAARAILGKFGIGTLKQEKNATDYLGHIKTYSPDTFNAVKEMMNSAIESAKPYGDIPYSDFVSMRDTVDAIWSLAKTVKEIEIEGKVQTKESAIESLTARLDLIDGKKSEGKIYEKRKKQGDLKTKGLSQMAALTRIEFWCDAMDNGDPNGAFRTLIWNPVVEGSNKFREMRHDTNKQVQGLIDKFIGKESKNQIFSKELSHTFDSFSEVIHALLHTGNDSNKKKLLLGYGWGEVDEQGNLDSKNWDRFTNRLMDDGVLTKKHFDFVQAIWDLNESLKPDAQKAHRLKYGRYFDEVTAKKFSNRFGDYDGGYMPAIYDPELVFDKENRDAQRFLDGDYQSRMFPSTLSGFTKTRNEAYHAPLSLDLNLIQSHIDQVLKFSHIGPAVDQVAKIVLDRNFSNRLREHDSNVIKDTLVPWLDRSVQQSVSAPSKSKTDDGIYRYLRTVYGMQAMFFNMKNVMMQFHGLPVGAVKVAPAHIVKAGKDFLFNPKESAADIADKSLYMKNKLNEQGFDMATTLNDIVTGASKYEKAKDFFKANTYFLQTAAQNVVNIMVWKGGYNESIEKGYSHNEAVKIADSAVSMTQHNFAPESMSAKEHGTPFERLFSMFFSYFNLKANLKASEYYKTVKYMGLKSGMYRGMYVALMTSMIPSALMAGLGKALSGQTNDDNGDQSIWDSYLGKIAQSEFHEDAMMGGPIMGQFLSAAGSILTKHKPFDDRISLSPVFASLEASTKLPREISKSFETGKISHNEVYDALTLIGLLAGVPATPLARPINYLNDVSEGKTNPTGPIDFTRGLINGK